MTLSPRILTAIIAYALAIAAIAMTDFGERGFYFDNKQGNAAAADRDESSDTPPYDLNELRVLNRSVGYVRSHYVDPERVKPREMFVEALHMVERTVAEMLVEEEHTGEELTAVTLRIDTATERFDLSRVTNLYEMTWKLKESLRFVDGKLPNHIDRADIEYAAVNGLLNTLDPHSILLNPETYREMQVGTSGKFGGLGIVITTRTGPLSVVTVLHDTPAFRAGLKNRDQITQIGELSTVNMGLEEAVQKLRGDVGTPVTVWISRDGWDEPRPFEITREEIKIESIQSEKLGRGVGYVRIKNFQQNTYADLTAALDKLRASNDLRTGLVLDLRNDPGGLLGQAIAVSNLFLEEGTIVTTVGSSAKVREEKKASRKGTLTDLPVVILVNNGSASASEIVTGALKNNDRAIVLGEQTFGKGSVQVLYEIEDQHNETAALKLTIAQYLTPGDQSIQSVGIVPDLVMYPVSLKKSDVDLYVSEKDLMGEKELDNHLVGKRSEAGRNAEVLRYYEPSEGDNEGETDTEEEASLDDADYNTVEVDYLMRFARDMLVAAGTPSRSQILTKSRTFLRQSKAQEEDKILNRLAELGVNWSAGPTKGGTTALKTVVRPEPTSGRVAAGESMQLTVEVTNEGSQPVHRIRAVSKSENYLFDDLEWVLGHIDAGESRSWTLKVKAPQRALSRRDPVSIALFSGERELESNSGEEAIEIIGKQRPVFSFAYQVRDAQGNGDGLLQKGEDVELAIALTNIGEGDAFKTTLNVKNMSKEGVFLNKGTHKFEELKVGASTTATYAFRVLDTFEKDEVELEISAYDSVLRAYMSSLVKIPISPANPTRLETSNSKWRTKQAVQLRTGASDDAPLVATLESGASVAATGQFGTFIEVQLAEELKGFAPQSQLEALSSSATVDSPPTPRQMEVPSTIELTAASAAVLETDKTTFKLEGKARFVGSRAPRQDVYIYRNQDKVFYKGVRGGDKAHEVEFSTEVELEDGVNFIVIYARRDDDSIAQRQLFVHKR